MSQNRPIADTNFDSLNLSPKITNQLKKLNFTTPTPIQQQAIPTAATGEDIIGIAQTGTGKTLAFLLPTIQQISQRKQPALIVTPTRELATQVEEDIRKIGGPLGIRHALLIGGAPIKKQINQLKQKPHVYIGTPGRIIDHLEQNTLNLSAAGILVLDEADRMLDMGFMPQINQILEQMNPHRQTLLFSATMPPEVTKIATKHMKKPQRVEIARAGTIADKVSQELFCIRQDQKNQLLDTLLEQYQGTVLIFSRTKHGAGRIRRTIKHMGHAAAEIHSNLSLSQRRRSLEGFKKGKFRVLVATDIAARGIDVTNIELVINYDLPENPDDYVHRVGRTGRAGKTGQAISFVTPDQKGKIRQLERLTRTKLPISPTPILPPHRSRTDKLTSSQRPKHTHKNRRQTTRARANHSSRRAPRVHM